MPARMITANNLRACREQAGMRQDIAAGFAGIAPTHLCELEQGKHTPRPKTLQRLARTYRMTVAQLTGDAPIGSRK